MSVTDKPNKEEIISEFKTMKEMELVARDLYIKIARSPDVPQQLKIAFAMMAKEENTHADIVQKITNIVTNTL